jgi:hypothetical protein
VRAPWVSKMFLYKTGQLTFISLKDSRKDINKTQPLQPDSSDTEYKDVTGTPV